jgi:hypothetical protein
MVGERVVCDAFKLVIPQKTVPWWTQQSIALLQTHLKEK